MVPENFEKVIGMALKRKSWPFYNFEMTELAIPKFGKERKRSSYEIKMELLTSCKVQCTEN